MPSAATHSDSKTPILVVDDDPDLLRLLSLRLGAAGHAVTAVASAEEALARLELARPRLVLSDVRLPGMDGLKLYDAIQARYPGLPVILLTAHGTIPDAVDATMRGVFSYLTKPFDGQELMAAVDRALAVSAAATPHASEADRKSTRLNSSH